MKTRCKKMATGFLVAALTFGTACNGVGFLGLQDYQRDLLGLVLNGIGNGGTLAIALLGALTPGPAGPPGPQGVPGAQGVPGVDGASGPAGPAGASVPGADGAPGPAGPAGPTGPAGPAGADGADGTNGTNGTNGVDGAPGAQGPVGPQGPAGPILFDQFVEDFFGTVPVALGSQAVQVVLLREPTIGINVQTGDLDRVAFRFAIPRTYTGVNPVVLRLFVRRAGALPPLGTPFVARIWGKRLVNGSATIDNLIDGAGRLVTINPAAAATEFKVIDLPLLNAVPNGLGGMPLAAGDFIAMEIAPDVTNTDAGLYHILGAEFYETLPGDPAAAAPAGAAIN